MDALSKQKILNRLDDPAVRARCVKLPWRREIQSDFISMGSLLLVFGLFFLIIGYWGDYTPRSDRYRPPKPAFIPYGFASLGGAVALFSGFWLFQNYSLIDPQEQWLYRYSQFLFWRKRRVIFRAGEILAVTTDCRRRSSKYGTRWYYRVVAIGRNGQKEPLGNWLRDGISECNAQARDFAAKLRCPSQTGLAKNVVRMEMQNGIPTVEFGPPPLMTTPAVVRTIFYLALVTLYFVMILTLAQR